MANSIVCQSKWKPIVEPRRAKPKAYRQAPTHWLNKRQKDCLWNKEHTTEENGSLGFIETLHKQ